jgi:hypothetical protein
MAGGTAEQKQQQKQNLPLMGDSSKGAVLFSVSSSSKVW